MLSVSDICVPDEVTDFLRNRGWGITRARDYDLSSQPDTDVWGVARRENRALISVDTDFLRFRGAALNAHPGCIVVNAIAGIRGRETSGELVIRVFRLALPYLPTKADMRESKV